MDEWRRAVLTTDMHGINHHAVQPRATRPSSAIVIFWFPGERSGVRAC